MAKPTYFYARLRMASGQEHLIYLDGYQLDGDTPTDSDYESACKLTEDILAKGCMSDWNPSEPYGQMITTHCEGSAPVCVNRHMVESYTIVAQDT